MRVLHINVSYIVSALHQTMIEHLNELGVENKVFVPTYDKNRSIIECKDYVTVSECFKKWDRIFYFRKQRKIISSLLENYDVSQFDLIHAYTLFTDGNAAMELSRKYGIPYVVAVRNTDMNDFFKKMIHLRSHGVKILRNAKAVFFLSPVYRDRILQQYVPAKYRKEIMEKSYVIPNGIDDFWHDHKYTKNGNEIQRVIKTERKIKCIYVGGIDRNKNVELTLKALTELEKQGWNCTLTCVGRIVDQSVYAKLCNYDCFNYVAPQKKEELIDYYRNADIFVMPSHTETFGLVYAEAMSQGLPVIYTRGQGFDGQFPEGDVGYAVDASSIESVVNVILACIDNYANISHRCVNSFSKFSWESIVQRYQYIYEDIAACK